jgi:hypothetical protein
MSDDKDKVDYISAIPPGKPMGMEVTIYGCFPLDREPLNPDMPPNWFPLPEMDEDSGVRFINGMETIKAAEEKLAAALARVAELTLALEEAGKEFWPDDSYWTSTPENRAEPEVWIRMLASSVRALRQLQKIHKPSDG